MPSMLGDLIKNAVRQEVKNAIIASPRFSDYRVQEFIETGAFDSIDVRIQQELSQKIVQTENSIKNDILNNADFATGVLNTALSRGAGLGLVTKFIPIIGTALAAPEIINTIIDFLIQPGGPFDKRLKIILEKQQEQFLSRLEQKRRQIGQSQVVISQFDGFGNLGGRLTTNTLEQVRSTGTANIGLNEIQIGMRK